MNERVDTRSTLLAGAQASAAGPVTCGVGALLGLVLAPAPDGDDVAQRLSGQSRYALPVGGLALARRAVRDVRAAGAERVLLAGDAALGLDVGPGAESAPLAAALHAAAAHPGPLLLHAGDGFAGEALLPAVRTLGRQPIVLTDAGGAPVALLAQRLPADARDLAELIARLEADGPSALARAIPGAWRYADTEESLLEGNRLALDALPLGDVRAAASGPDEAQIEGRVVIHPSARLERTSVRGPALIGPRALLVDSFVGPYTTIGAGVRLEGAELEHSLVLEGASIRNLDRRLEASVVGRNAQVVRRFAVPASIRLRVGEDAEVSLS